MTQTRLRNPSMAYSVAEAKRKGWKAQIVSEQQLQDQAIEMLKHLKAPRDLDVLFLIDQRPKMMKLRSGEIVPVSFDAGGRDMHIIWRAPSVKWGRWALAGAAVVGVGVLLYVTVK